MRLSIFASISAFIALVGCSSSPSPDKLSTSVQQVGTTGSAHIGTPSSANDVGAAYVHQIALSRFLVGAGVTERDEYGMHKFVGDQGVFAARSTGLALGLTNADAVVRQHPGPLPGGATAHNLAVHDYFVGAGLPVVQIASVDIMPAMSVTADLANNRTFAPKLEFYFSIIRRQIGGVSVPDSYAWARINQDGAVVDESVYWPQIPNAVVANAQAFKAKLADSVSSQEFLATLPPKKAGQLVIHHTPGEWTGAFAAVAVYDAPDDNVDFKATIHYDSTGTKVVMPHEAKDAWGPLPVMPAKSR